MFNKKILIKFCFAGMSLKKRDFKIFILFISILDLLIACWVDEDCVTPMNFIIHQSH